ncbi:MAG TPA: hypothetical protein VGK67_30720 [Myxococcales bacterium]|jgi:hypothetical protein
MRPAHLSFLLTALLSASACGDTALARRYESLQSERKAVQQDLTQASNEVDRLFFEATSSERQAGKAIAGAARCVTNKGAYRPAEPLTFGPARQRYQEHSYLFQEGAPFETAALECVQASMGGR